MDESAVKSTVLSLDSARTNSVAKAELLGFLRGMQFFSWDMLVSKVFNYCGLAVTESFLTSDAITPALGSVAADLGHATMQELVSKPEAELGIGQDWAEFKQKAAALIYRNKYALSSSASYLEIIDQVEDTTKILKRAPGDAAEFHSAKEKALNDNIIEMRRDYEFRASQAKERHQELMKGLTASKAEVDTLRNDNQLIKQDSAARIQAITREMAQKQEQLEQQHDQKVKDACALVLLDCERRIADEKLKFEALVSAAVTERQVAEQAVNDYKARISAGDLIEASVLAELNAKLDEAVSAEENVRAKFLEISDELTQAVKRIELITDEKSLLQNNIDMLNEQIARLETSMRDLVEQRTGSTEFAVLNDRLNMRMEEIVKLRDELEKQLNAKKKAESAVAEWKGRYQQLRAQGEGIIKRLQGNVNILNRRVKTLNGDVAAAKGETSQVKIALGVLAVLVAALTATVWVTAFM